MTIKGEVAIKKGMMNMKAFVHKGDKYEYVTNYEVREVGRNDVKVALRAAGVNRRDLYIQQRRKGERQPLVLGSDGAGVIVEVGQNVTKWEVGESVIINPSLRWFDKSDVPPETFDILGMPDDGTFGEYIVIDEEQIEPILSHLTWEENASIALAGMTGYRALVTKGNIQQGETVFIPGGSSGVATFMIQVAKAKGARVITSTRNEVKKEALRSLGADIVINTVSDWPALLYDETVDLIVDSVGAATFQRSLEVLKKGGRFVTFGSSTTDEVTFDIRTFFYNQQKIYGSTMASRDELRELLTLMRHEKMKPLIDKIYSLEDANVAMESLEASTQVGKIVLKIE